MTELSILRTEFLDFLDNAEIFSHLQRRCQEKGLAPPNHASECQVMYERFETNFEQKINAGLPTSLPPNNLWLLTLEGLRSAIPMQDMSFQKLELIVEFDAQENLAVKYIVDDSESIESWVQRHPDFNIDAVRGAFDSYLLEFFEKEGLELRDNKLYRKSNQSLVTFENFTQAPNLNSFRSLRESVLRSKWTQSLEAKVASTRPGIQPDTQLSAN